MKDINRFKFVVSKSPYGNIYNYCYKELEEFNNVDLIEGYISFNSLIEKKIYYKHFTKRTWLPFRSIWNKRYYKNKFNKKDSIIFICYYVNIDIYRYNAMKSLRKKYKNSKFVLFFNDLICKNLKNKSFEKIKKDFEVILSFDYNDCQKYRLYNHPLVYSAPKELELLPEDIDVYFCGKAKNRLSLIMSVFESLRKKGIKCKFILYGVPIDQRINNVEIEYVDKFMSYDQNIEYIKRSKCLLEIMQEGGTGYTLRTCEAVAYNKKIITNNRILKDAEFYDKDMIYIFNNIDDINVEFIKKNKGEYKDRHYFSPVKLLEKVINILERKED